jgi:uncharacterized protein
MKILRVDDVPAQPWKNGGGLTREMLAWPEGGDWQCRISVADIEADGPFSAFPGVERWFTVLKGAGVELTVDGQAHRLTRTSPPLRFDGAAVTRCRLLDGPTRDLNLMLRGARGGTRGGIWLARDGAAWAPPGSRCGLFTAVAGRCGGVDLPAYALLWFDAAPSALVFEAGERPAAAIGWWIAATPQEAAR